MRMDKSGRMRPVGASSLRSGRAGVRQLMWQGDQRPARSEVSVVDLHVGRRPDHQSGQTSPDERQPVPALCIHDHEWVVYSTAMQEGWLMVQCVECLALGTIDEPSEEEWSAAFHAPSRARRDPSWTED
jgi:hypothetical protein